MNLSNRRAFISQLGVMAAMPLALAADRKVDASWTLGFSLYGMKSLKAEDALSTLSKMGYDSIEFFVQDGGDLKPETVAVSRRQELRKLLAGLSLKLTSLLENLNSADATKQVEMNEKIRLAADLGHSISPEAPPFINTGLAGNWEKDKEMIRDRVAAWAKTAASTKTILLVKPHRMSTFNSAEQALWLLDQIKNPWLKLNFDPSHFVLRDQSLRDSLEKMIPHTKFVHVKDARMENGKAVFTLPGESGNVDYPALFRQLAKGGYRGDINVEVSSMVSRLPDYDAVRAAKSSYEKMAAALREAGIQRPRKS